MLAYNVCTFKEVLVMKKPPKSDFIVRCYFNFKNCMSLKTFNFFLERKAVIGS